MEILGQIPNQMPIVWCFFTSIHPSDEVRAMEGHLLWLNMTNVISAIPLASCGAVPLISRYTRWV